MIKATRRLAFEEIPIIDIGALANKERSDLCIESLRTACADVGFFYIKNHGFPSSLINDLRRVSAEFFSLPMNRKTNFKITPQIQGYLPLGYRSYEGEQRAGTSHQEGFWVGHERRIDPENPLDGPNQWPPECPEFQKMMGRYFEAAEDLSKTLMRGFSLALGLEEDHIAHYFSRPLSRLKVNHYPPQDSPLSENNLGVVPHCDSGAFTILWQDSIGGLEIQNKEGQWVGAPPIADTFVVNIGNIMEMWSNGRFSSTPHRVINVGNDNRYSIPLFVNPSAEVEIKPLVGDLDAFESFHYGTYQRDLWRNTFPVAEIS